MKNEYKAIYLWYLIKSEQDDFDRYSSAIDRAKISAKNIEGARGIHRQLKEREL